MSEVAAQAMPTHISVRATEDRVEDITARGSNPLAALRNAPQAEKVCLSRRRMKGKSEKPMVTRSCPQRLFMVRETSKIRQLRAGPCICGVSTTMTGNHLSVGNKRRLP